jgi:RHS repeat-associated protein
VPCEAAAMSVTPTAGGATITYSLPKAWLTDPARTFPVMVDPSIWIYDDGTTTTTDTFTCSKYGYTSYWTYNYLQCGMSSAGDSYRTYVRFPVQSVVPSNATVSDAEFKLYQYSGAVGQTISVARPTAWWGDTTSWLDMPPQTYVGTVSGPANTYGWIDYHCGSLCQDWVDGSLYNYGLAFYAGSGNFRSFRAREYSNSGARPHLLVDFTVPTPDPVQASVTTTSSAWFTETDANGDLVPDAGNDTTNQGRGSVSLSWPGDPDAGGYHIYLHDGNTFRQVGSTISTSWTSAGANVYRTDSAIAALSANYSGNPYSSGSRDLRDDPNALYKKTAGTLLDTSHEYLFKIVPFDTWGTEIALSSCETLTVGLDNRTKHTNDDVRHTEHDLGEIMRHSAAVVLDANGGQARNQYAQGTLKLDVTDLEIASWGPTAALSRSYRSDTTTTTSFAPGWRFNYERSLCASGSVVTYTDEAGERRSFVETGGVFVSPSGDYDVLSRDGSDYRLTAKDRSYLKFNSAGALTHEIDKNGNTVTYAWTTNHLSIIAANGQSIEASFTPAGSITQASYTTSAGARTVEYNYGAGYEPGAIQIVRYNGSAPENRVAIYSYRQTYWDRIVEISEPRFTAAGPYGANWKFVYDEDTSRLSEVQWPGHDDDNLRRTDLTYGSSDETATATTYAVVGGVAGRTVQQHYGFNPTGTEAWHSNPKLSTETTTTLDKWSTLYSFANDPTEQTTPEGVTTRQSYDTRGNVVRSIDGNGNVTTSVYDDHDQVVQQTSPRGSTTYNTYDTAGNLTVAERVLTAAGERARAEYSHNASGTVTSEKRKIDDSAWAETDFSNFAASGAPQTVTAVGVELSAGAQPVDLSVTGSYDAFGNLLWQKDALGHFASKDATYNLDGRLLSATDTSGTVTHHSYDVLGYELETSRTAGAAWADRKVTVAMPDGSIYEETLYVADAHGDPQVASITTHAYDESGNEITTSDSTAGTTTRQFNSDGDVIRENTPEATSTASGATSIGYDADGQITTATAPGASVSDVTSYTADGEVASVDPGDAGPTSFGYDAEGNPVSITSTTETGTVTSGVVYDLGGRQASTSDAAGMTTIFGYDLMDRPISATTATSTAQVTYNTLGWVLSQTQLDGQAKTFAYDAAGRVLSESLDGATTNAGYDDADKTLWVTTPDGARVDYAYDDFGRVTGEKHTRGGVVLHDLTSKLDALGRTTTTTDAVTGVVSSTSYPADQSDRVARLSYGSTQTTLTVDSAGREKSYSASVAFPGMSAVGATRSADAMDAAGRPTLWSLASGSSSATSSVGFDGSGRIASFGGFGLGSRGIAYGYNARTAQQATETIDLAYPGPSADSTMTYAYDPAGRLTGSRNSAETTLTYAYSPYSQVTTAGAATLSYTGGPYGRLLQRKVGASTWDYTFDGRGRRQTTTSSSSSSTAGYDASDRMTTYRRDEGKDGSIEASATYVYDASGMRTTSVVTSGSVTTTTTYAYDGLTLLSTRAQTGTSTVAVDYLSDASGRPYAAAVSLPNTSTALLAWLVTNQRGDVVELASASGEPFAYFRYDAYGQVASSGVRAVSGMPTATAQSITDAVRLRYAGYVYDAESGYYYLSARYYDPVTCQFTTKDPTLSDGAANPYVYCMGDPVGTTDRSGLIAEFDDDGRVSGSEAAYHASVHSKVKKLKRRFHRAAVKRWYSHREVEARVRHQIQIERVASERRYRAARAAIAKREHARVLARQRTDALRKLRAFQVGLDVATAAAATASVATGVVGVSNLQDGVGEGALFVSQALGGVAITGTIVSAAITGYRYSVGDATKAQAVGAGTLAILSLVGGIVATPTGVSVGLAANVISRGASVANLGLDF